MKMEQSSTKCQKSEKSMLKVIFDLGISAQFQLINPSLQYVRRKNAQRRYFREKPIKLPLLNDLIALKFVQCIHYCLKKNKFVIFLR